MGVALLSAGGLVLEIALTRVLSVVYFYAYVYVVLSVAVLGVGLGAALATARPAWRQPERLSLWAAFSGLAALLLTVLVVAASSLPLRLVVLAGAAVPFAFLGLALATAFSAFSQESPRLYWADLGGAGLGALLAVPLLNLLGGLDGMLAAAGLLALSGLAFPRPASRLAFAPLVCALVSLALLGNLAFGWLKLDLRILNTPKPLQAQLQEGAELVKTRWNAFARTDLVRRPDTGATYLYMDGGAGSLVPDTAQPEKWRGDIGSFPFVASRPESVFLIGPGGGLDVALARLGGAEDVTAVEVNGASVALARGLEPILGSVYGGTEVHIDEGRSVLRRQNRLYDLILLSHVVTQAAEVRGYALTENGLYTVEAFGDYLDHLTPGGELAIKLYDELTLTRALVTALQAFKERGLSEAEGARHLLALLDTRAEPPIPLLVVKKEAIDQAEAVGLARAAETLGFALLYVPGLLANPPLDGVLEGRTDLEDIIASAADVNLRPTTDDWPFFYLFERGLPGALEPLLYSLGGLLLLGLLALGVRQRRATWPLPRAAPLLFAALGVGFMVTEVGLLQRVGLFLGHPTLTLSVVLGTLLVGGGLGSLLGGRLPLRDTLMVALSGFAVAAALALWSFLWPLSDAFRGAGLPLRVFLTALSLAPLALLMGVPFPVALRAVGRSSATHVALAWAVNGVASVMGSVGATVLALLFGFESVIMVGVVAYAILGGAAFLLDRAARRTVLDTGVVRKPL